MPMLAPGDAAPGFEVTAHDGTTVKLSDHAGKRVLLWFYPVADTPGWTVEGKGFRDRIQQFHDRDTVIFGVSFDTVADNEAFAEKYSFPFLLLCDTDRAIGLAYGAARTADEGAPRRISYLIGPDGAIERAYAKVDAATHAEQVLADLG